MLGFRVFADAASLCFDFAQHPGFSFAQQQRTRFTKQQCLNLLSNRMHADSAGDGDMSQNSLGCQK